MCPELSVCLSDCFTRDEDALKKLRREIMQLRKMLLTKEAKYQEEREQARAARARLLELEAGSSHQNEGLGVSVDASGNLDVFSLSYDDISDADLSGVAETLEVPTSHTDMVHPGVVSEVAAPVAVGMETNPADAPAVNPPMDIDQSHTE